jgi:hypothetical protein
MSWPAPSGKISFSENGHFLKNYFKKAKLFEKVFQKIPDFRKKENLPPPPALAGRLPFFLKFRDFFEKL